MKLKSLVSCSLVAFAALLGAGAGAGRNPVVACDGGALGEWVNDLAKGFNEARRNTRSSPTFKGSYPTKR